MVLLSGFEPELMVPKTIVLSITPQEHDKVLRSDKFGTKEPLVPPRPTRGVFSKSREGSP